MQFFPVYSLDVCVCVFTLPPSFVFPPPHSLELASSPSSSVVFLTLTPGHGSRSGSVIPPCHGREAPLSPDPRESTASVLCARTSLPGPGGHPHPCPPSGQPLTSP